MVAKNALARQAIQQKNTVCGSVCHEACTASRLRLMARRAFLDFLDGRRNDWGSIFRVMKFQMHAPANEMQFEH